jgi:hypothetical protein
MTRLTWFSRAKGTFFKLNSPPISPPGLMARNAPIIYPTGHCTIASIAEISSMPN